MLPDDSVPETKQPFTPGAQDPDLTIDHLFLSIDQLLTTRAVDFLDDEFHRSVLLG
jgi:hypothetical protein